MTRQLQKKPRFFKGKKCDNCGGKSGYTNNSGKRVTLGVRHVHVNIDQKIPKHYFCSKECKEAWIYNGGKALKKKNIKELNN